ncbi:MAG: hypothetical protein IH945_11505 [Armatimonadetes bacterium]|nr:hypothetical protein [Armatimonadota bacterium]
MPRNARARRGMNAVALRGIGIVIGLTLAYGTGSTGFNFMIAGAVDLVKGEMKKFQGRPGPYSDPRTQPRPRTSPVGRDPIHRGGVRTAKDVADLVRAEQARLERFNERRPENLLASTSPVPQLPPLPPIVGDPEEGEGLGGGSTGVGFGDMHEPGGGPKASDFFDIGNGWCDGWVPGMGIPCFLPGGSGTGTGAGGTGGLGLGGGFGGGGGLNTNTGNFITTVPITGWSARGDSYVDFTLIHNSMYPQELGAVTDVGHSWSHSYSIEVNYIVNPMQNWPPQQGDNAYLIWMDGQRIQFTYNGTIEGPWARFDPPPGYHAYIYYQAGATYKLETKDQRTYWFNNAGSLTAQDDPWGNRITVSRNDIEEIITVDDGTGRSLTFTYANGNIDSVMAPDQQVWSFDTDINNDLIKVTYPPLNNTYYDINFIYNAYHDITTFTNKLNKSWTFTYAEEERSELTSVTNPLDKMWSISYETGLVTIMNPDFEYVEHHYQDGRIISYVDEAQYVVNFWADADENLTTVQDKRDEFWDWTYDGQGNMVTFRDPMQRTWTYTYNADNNLTSIKDPQSNTLVTIGYDDGSGGTLPAPTDSTDELWRIASNLLSSRLPRRRLCVRLIGMGVSGIDRSEEKQTLLFDEETGDRSRRLDEVTDQIKDRFGIDAVRRAITSGRNQSRDRHSTSDP